MPEAVAVHEERQTSDTRSRIDLIRLVRLRRDDEQQIPSSIVIQIAGTRLGEEVQIIDEAELTREDGRHLLLPRLVWEAGEALIDALPHTSDKLHDPTEAETVIDSLIESVEAKFLVGTGKGSQLAFAIVVAAVRRAFMTFVQQRDLPLEDHTGFFEHNIDRITRYAVAPPPAPPVNEGKPANAFDDAPYIKPLPKDGTKGHLLEREALRYGMSSIRYPNGAFVVTSPTGEQLGFKWGRSPLASGVALSICSYKEATRRLLKKVDVPVPKGRVFSIADRKQAVDYANSVGYPVVCKPVAGLRGIGVISNVRDREALEDALDLYQQSELGNDDFVIEEHVPGEDYRIVVIGDEVVASVVRAPASVTGDGLHNIADLIEYKNRARKQNPHLSSRLIKFTEALDYQLRLTGLTYSSVPPAEAVVTLANSANLSQGGDSFEIAEELHPSIKELSVKAVQAVPGLGFCGLDMLIEDHRKPTWEQKVTVIELNAHAAIGSAQYPMWGTPYPVARKFFDATAAAAGIVLPDKQATSLSLKLDIRGRVTGVGYRKWFQRRAEDFGLHGYVKNNGERRVEAYVQGTADAAAAIGYLAMSGPDRAVVTSVTVAQAGKDEAYEAFQVE